jgi:hypothetical protein
MRCGVIVSRYKGPALGAEALRPPAPPPPVPPSPSLPLSSNETVRMTFTPPAPEGVSGGGGFHPSPAAAMAGGGTVYEGPPPGGGSSAYGGTVYGGPPPGAVQPRGFSGVRGEVKSGELLNQTFSIYFANFLPFVLLTAIALAPLFAIQGIFLSSMSKVASGGGPSPLLILSIFLLFLGAILCPYIATGAITYGVFQQLRQKDTSLGDCLGQGLSALPRMLGLAIVQGLMIGLAFLACIIPGIILAIRWAVSVPAAVTEKTGASESMTRSTFLTDGYRGDVFGFLFVLGAINLGLSFLVRLATASNPTLNLLLSGLVSLFTTGLSATGTAVLYYRLRSAKESIDVDQIASVFS